MRFPDYNASLIGIADLGAGSTRVLMARIHICSFYFFDQNEDRRDDKIIEVYQLACDFIDVMGEEDNATGFILYSPQIVFRAIMLSAFVILRILRSDLRPLIDLAAGERRLFSVINSLKKRSLLNNDLDAKNVTILGLLWQSKTAFRRSDGSYDGLRMRNRVRGVCCKTLRAKLVLLTS